MATLAAPYARSLPATASTSIPWPITVGVAAATSSMLGLAWDISWHRTIGRDTFWTPAHMMIYACGLLAAVMCGYLVFATTFGKSPAMRAESVSVLGFRAPLGAFIAAWGGLAMMASGPFDNWWHAAYGLDVTILSPPHAVLGIGMNMIAVGVLFLILAAMNRAAGAEGAATISDGRPSLHAKLQRIFLYMGSLMVITQMTYIMELTWDIRLHSSAPYVAIAIALPVALAVIKRASDARWACTSMAAVYTLFAIAQILILPLVPGTPKLGPVLNPVTHLVPMKFPILIVVPAIALDLLWNRLRTWKPWKLALVSGIVFVSLMVAVEWPFASFLMSKASANRFFGTIYFDYNSSRLGFDRSRAWLFPQAGAPLFRGLAIAVGAAFASTWIGLKLGTWMRGVQR